MKSTLSYVFPPVGWATLAICDYAFVIINAPWRYTPSTPEYCLHLALIALYNLCLAMALWSQVVAMTQDPGYLDYYYSEYNPRKFSTTVQALFKFLDAHRTQIEESLHKTSQLEFSGQTIKQTTYELTIPIELSNKSTFIEVEQQVLLENETQAKKKIENVLKG